MEVGGQLHVPATLCSGKEHQYLLKRKLGGPQNQYGSFKKQKNLSPLPGIKSQIVHYTLAIHKVTLRNYIKSEPIKM
jgi:hypothetical protein